VTYHRVTEFGVTEIYWSPPFLHVNKDTLFKQMQFIKNYYSVVMPEELLDVMNKKSKNIKNPLLVTFDDGYEDNYLLAFPVLRELHIKAIIFLTVGKIESRGNNLFWWDLAYSILEQLERNTANGNSYTLKLVQKNILDKYIQNKSAFFLKMNDKPDKEINVIIDKIRSIDGILSYKEKNTMLTWDQILKMKSVFSIGSHTMSHRNLLALPEEEVDFELSRSKQIIEERTGEKVPAFSYTAGNHNSALREKVEKHGYRFAVTTDSGVSDLGNPYALKRINVWEGSSASPWGTFSKGIFALHLTGLLG
jgi:peptidoglycan/xylan/chitin deacetylase (PgdA/CDA1 family)